MERKKTEYEVEHEGKLLTFVNEKHGLETFRKVKQSLEDAGLRAPSMGKIVSFIHHMICKTPKDSGERREFLEFEDYQKIWGFTGGLYVPKEGIYFNDMFITDDNRNPVMVKSLLNDDLASEWGWVRFVPKELISPSAELNYSNFLKFNHYLIGLMGKNGVRKLDEIVSGPNFDPIHLPSFEGDRPIKFVSSLSLSPKESSQGGYNLSFHMVDVNRDIHDLNLMDLGYGFGYIH